MRLIDADALKKDIADNYVFTGFVDLLNDFAIAIDGQPTVDAVERKRGRWISDVAFYDEDGCPCFVLRCSECGEAYPESNFCPNCGADMRKGEEE